MGRILGTFDKVYDYCRATTGRAPQPARNLDGLLTIAVVPDTCGAGCAYLGFTGIELLPQWFGLLYGGVRDRGEFDHVLFYEFGRNFWFYQSQLAYQPPAEAGSVVTGYAVVMQFLSMDATGVAIGSFRGMPFSEFRALEAGLIDGYEANPTLTWHNTLAVGAGPPNEHNLGGADLFASVVLRLRRDYGGQAFISRLWRSVAARPDATGTQDAVDNFIVAASVAAGRDLSDLFTAAWRWPLSEAARGELKQHYKVVGQ